MLKLNYWSILFCSLLFIANVAMANTHWNELRKSDLPQPVEQLIKPNAAFYFSLDIDKVWQDLVNAPNEFDSQAWTGLAQLSLPMPSGKAVTFNMADSPVMSPVLSAKFPLIRSWSGQSADYPGAILRVDLSNLGFHGILSTPDGTIYFDPYSREVDGIYMSYFRADLERTDEHFLNCESEDGVGHLSAPVTDEELFSTSGEELRVYRLAMACTGEYASFHGGTVENSMSAIVTTVNRVNLVYMRDLSIKFELVDDNDELIFLNAGSDPYSNDNGGAMLNQNQQTVDAAIGNSNYDIGHVVSTGGGGVANFQSTCDQGNKARGVTGLNAPIGDAFDIDYVSHEIGHQFGGSHTFNGDSGSCGGGNRSANSAYEPGSGSTIMAYAGLCPSQNVQSNSDDYFHVRSLQQMLNFTNNGFGDCGEVFPTTNSNPSSEAGAGGFTIPGETPFQITGSGSDPNSFDQLTYCWEQYDLGNAGNALSAVGSAPSIRSINPTTQKVRTIPNWDILLNDTPNSTEILADYSRNYNFRLTTRDNHPLSGGVEWDQMSITVAGTTGPFEVTEPNGNEEWQAGITKAIEWDIAGTNAAPVNCSHVEIWFSDNGGESFDHLVAENALNDGVELITVPALSCFDCKVMVKAKDNIFFTINDGEFRIIPPLNLGFNGLISDICAGGNALNLSVSAESNILGINGPVTLVNSTTTEGITISWSTDQIELPGNVDVSIAASENIPTGEYPVTLFFETNAGSQPQTFMITVVNNALPIGLVSPLNGLENVSGPVSFSWAERAGTSLYDWQLASSPSFGATTIQTQADPENEAVFSDPLSPNTIYYWRVRSLGSCGNSPYSQVYSFRTPLSNPAASNPIVINSGGFELNQGTQKVVNSQFLLATDPATNATDILFTLTGIPTTGSLFLAGNELGLGDSFSQRDINDGSVIYDHDWASGSTSDSFNYEVSNPNNGWAPGNTFLISIVPDAVGINEHQEKAVSIFPNPAEDFILAQTNLQGLKSWSIYTIDGKLILSGTFNELQEQISVRDLSSGIYLFSVNELLDAHGEAKRKPVRFVKM